MSSLCARSLLFARRAGACRRLLIQPQDARLSQPVRMLHASSTVGLAVPTRQTAVQLSCAVGLAVGTGLGLQRYLARSASCEAAVASQLDTSVGELTSALVRRDTSEAALLERVELQRQETSFFAVVVRSLRSWLRALYIAAVLGPVLLTLPLRNWQSTSDAWWCWCVRSFERSGALFIKLAQWSSSRPDLFGEEACARFAYLQDSTHPHSWEATVRTLERSFGDRWTDELRLEREPIGSGCIAQVYRGEMREADGSGAWRPVAIKVVHPAVREYIRTDMNMLRGLGWLIERWPSLSWLSPHGMLTEFAGLLLMQLDLSVEARNLETFRRHFPPAESDVSFPEPLRPFVTSDVLVETFVDGEPFLLWANRAKPSQEVRQRICYEGVDAFMKMLFIDNFVHGDLHPGNIFVTTEGKLAFLDAGIAIRYSQQDHNHLIDVLSAFIQYDGYTGGMLMAERASAEEGAAEARDLHGFCTKIQKMVEMARDEPSFFDKVGECIATICQAACDHRIKMQAGFISIALSVKVVEGTVLQVDPLSIVAPRAKAVVLREQMKRKGERLLRSEAVQPKQRDDEERRLDEELRVMDAKRRQKVAAAWDARSAK